MLAQTGIFRLPRHSRDESSCFDFGVEAMFVAQFRSLHGVSTLPCLGVCPMFYGWDRRKLGGHATSGISVGKLVTASSKEKSLGFDFHENHDISTTLVHF